MDYAGLSTMTKFKWKDWGTRICIIHTPRKRRSSEVEPQMKSLLLPCSKKKKKKSKFSRTAHPTPPPTQWCILRYSSYTFILMFNSLESWAQCLFSLRSAPSAPTFPVSPWRCHRGLSQGGQGTFLWFIWREAGSWLWYPQGRQPADYPPPPRFHVSLTWCNGPISHDVRGDFMSHPRMTSALSTSRRISLNLHDRMLFQKAHLLDPLPLRIHHHRAW